MNKEVCSLCNLKQQNERYEWQWVLFNRLQFHQLHFILKATHESLTAKRVSQLGLACLLIFQYLLSSKHENRQINGMEHIYDETKSDCCYINLVLLNLWHLADCTEVRLAPVGSIVINVQYTFPVFTAVTLKIYVNKYKRRSDFIVNVFILLLKPRLCSSSCSKNFSSEFATCIAQILTVSVDYGFLK